MKEYCFCSLDKDGLEEPRRRRCQCYLNWSLSTRMCIDHQRSCDILDVCITVEIPVVLRERTGQ